jgi:hypothetical protein
MNTKHLLGIGVATLATLTHDLQAHIGYTGRNFGAFTGLESQSVTINNQAITGNFGWADAASGDLGDSHKARAYRFTLDNVSLVTLTFSANATATATSVGGLLPGFSIYNGLAAIAPFAPTQTSLPSSADHDGSDASLAWRTSWAQNNLGISYDYNATGGSWNAVGDWKIGGDGDLPGDFAQLSAFSYAGSSFDADRDGLVSFTTVLGPGNYTVLVGGIDLDSKGGATAALAFGVTGTLSVQAVPEPGTWALMATGLVGMWTLRRRTTRR